MWDIHRSLCLQRKLHLYFKAMLIISDILMFDVYQARCQIFTIVTRKKPPSLIQTLCCFPRHLSHFDRQWRGNRCTGIIAISTIYFFLYNTICFLIRGMEKCKCRHNYQISLEITMKQNPLLSCQYWSMISYIISTYRLWISHYSKSFPQIC